MIYDTVAIVATDKMDAVATAVSLRRAGIPVETFLTQSAKKQWLKARDYEVVILLDESPPIVMDRILGGKIEVSDDLLTAVKTALDGIVK